MRPGGGGVASDKMQIETNDLDWQLDYYCENINLPSKQMTTGQVVNVGAGFKYATNTAYSQLQATFKKYLDLNILEVCLKDGLH